MAYKTKQEIISPLRTTNQNKINITQIIRQKEARESAFQPT